MDEELLEEIEEQETQNIEEQNNEENSDDNTNILLRNTMATPTRALIVKGDELMLFKGASALGYATAHTFNITANEISVASKDHGAWGATEIGKLDWECTAECYYTDADYSALFTAMQAKTPITITFAKAGNYSDNGLSGVGSGSNVDNWTSTGGYTGQALITNLSANANTGEKATFSVTFKGYGAITAVS